EDQLKDLPREERYKKRLELEKPLIDEFWKWIYDTAAIALPKSKLGKAIAYAINQKPYMENYLKDGRCSISNNVAENAIRPFTVGRKNWLFCDTPKGADSSAVIYSIVETAKANNINVRDYLEYLFTVMPTEDWRNHPEMLDDLLPTSPEIRKKFKN
ncbi:MAG: transposase, partial [Clostridiales bacterium]|nr:transposase [Clostridiales bacterium]